jgi:small conductance mechanosensitive channel
MDANKIYNAFIAWIIHEGPKILLAVVVLFTGLWLIRLFKKWTNSWMASKKLDSSLQPFLSGVIFTSLQILLLLAVMQILGIQMTIFAAIVGGIGIAGGLALSGTLQNFTSGILILLLKPYKAGDIVIAQGVEGTVNSIQIFFTIITAYDNKIIIIPNSKLSNELITNLSRQEKRRLDIELKFPVSTAYQTVRDSLIKLAQTEDTVLKDPSPRIGISVLQPDGYSVMLSV